VVFFYEKENGVTTTSTEMVVCSDCGRTTEKKYALEDGWKKTPPIVTFKDDEWTCNICLSNYRDQAWDGACAGH